MSSIYDILKEAVKVGTNTKYTVVIDGISEQMTYIKLGTYLISITDNIKEIEIKLKE